MSGCRVFAPPSGGRVFCAAVFPTRLGWMAIVTGPQAVLRLLIGRRSKQAAQAALAAELDHLALESGCGAERRVPGRGQAGRLARRLAESLVARLQDYAAGKVSDFRDVAVEMRVPSGFARRVLHHCRRIPYGHTITYGQLARRAGSPAAARAAGRVMAANRVPIIVPCHRVVAADGSLGGFSAPGGVELKRRLLAMEAAGARKQETH